MDTATHDATLTSTEGTVLASGTITISAYDPPGIDQDSWSATFHCVDGAETANAVIRHRGLIRVVTAAGRTSDATPVSAIGDKVTLTGVGPNPA